MVNTSDPSNPAQSPVSRPLPLPKGYTVRDGRLFLHDMDLAALADHWLGYAGLDDAPLTVRYLPIIGNNYHRARNSFVDACKKTGYAGEIRLAYASKANPNEVVIKAALGAGADYECSSRVDGRIIRRAIENGWLTRERLILANGFKTPKYAAELIGLAADGYDGVVPIFDSAVEIPQFARSYVTINVGLRYRVAGHAERFGMDDAEIFAAAEQIAQAPNLTLTTFHALQQYPAIGNPEHMASLQAAFAVFQALRAKYPALTWFDIGGGLPAELTTPDDLQNYMIAVQQMIQSSSGDLPVPNLILESGRYMVGAHELKVYRVNRVKVISDVPYYILSGGIMSNLPDSWALGLEFPITALNHLDTSIADVRLAGLTCDPDDVYPHDPSHRVTLPADTDDLLVAFLDIGAYQDMLGGEGGAKHCLLSQGATLLIGDNPVYPTHVSYQPAPATDVILHQLGYGRSRFGTEKDER